MVTPPLKTTQLGKKGEQIAVEYLKSKGYEIVHTNYRFKKSEIDIIALIPNVMVFVEVKLRKNPLYGHPEQFVTKQKQIQIKKAAEEYIFSSGWHYNIRFDIVSITGNTVANKIEIMHFEDAFY